MDDTEVQKVIDQSYRKLYQVASPPIRRYILEEVLQADNDDAIVQKVIAECERYPPKMKILNSIREDGTWPISKQRKMSEDTGPGPPFGWTYITMLRNLYMLTDYWTSRSEGRIDLVLKRILNWQVAGGYIPGPWTDAFPIPHYNGFALRNLLRFGLEKNKRVQKLIRWLLSMQRPDGGWIVPYLQDVKYLPEYRNMKMADFIKAIGAVDRPRLDLKKLEQIPSCIWSTMGVVRGLIQSREWVHSKEVRRGADFFLDRFFKRNYHATFYQSEKNWTRLKYPTYFGSGLGGLDILSHIGYGPDDERMERPIRWLMSMRAKDGFWYQSERPQPEKDQWITATSLVILSTYLRNGRGRKA